MDEIRKRFLLVGRVPLGIGASLSFDSQLAGIYQANGTQRLRQIGKRFLFFGRVPLGIEVGV